MKRLIIHLIAILSGVLLLAFFQNLLMPKYISSIHEGNLIAEYYDEEKQHDVIFLGDCEVFSNISPVRLWEDYGITSYIRGSAQQLLWQSYYLLEETLTYEKPKVVVFNVLAMKYNEPQKEAYNRLTMDGMRLSAIKLKAVKASMTEGEDLITYLFPLLRYHSRWKELSVEDVKYLFHRDTISHNGYLMRMDVKPITVIPKGRKLADYSFGSKAYDYLDRMTKLCKDNQIELILIKSPSVYPYWYDEWDSQMEDYAQKHQVTYINFLKEADAMGIDYSNDTFDGGLHLNLSGAEKFTDYLGIILKQEFQVPDRRQNQKLSQVWAKKTVQYETAKVEQENELMKYGYLKSCGAPAQEASTDK